MLLDIRRSSEEALEPFGAVERTIDPASCKGRAGGRSHGNARRRLGRLAGVLAMLGGGLGATAERRDYAGGAAGAHRGRRPHGGGEKLA